MDGNSGLEVAVPDTVVEQVSTTEQLGENSEVVAEVQPEAVAEVQTDAADEVQPVVTDEVKPEAADEVLVETKATVIDFAQVQSIIEAFNAVYASEPEQVEQALIEFVSANAGFVDAVASFLSALSVARMTISNSDLKINLDADTDGEEVSEELGEDDTEQLDPVEECSEDGEEQDAQVSPSTEETVTPDLTEEPKPLLFGAFESTALTQDTNLDDQLAAVFTTEVQAEPKQESAPAAKAEEGEEVTAEGEIAQATPSLTL